MGSGEVGPIHEDTMIDGGALAGGGGMTRGFFSSFGLRIETRVLVGGDTARDDPGAVDLFFGSCRLAMTFCLRAWMRSAASFLQEVAIKGRDEVGLDALGSAMA